MLIAGCDPGSKNFAVSVVKIKKHPRDFQIKSTRMVSSTITSLKEDGVNQRLNKFISDISNEVQSTELLIAERFMARGLRGNTSELINMMLGATLLSAKEKRCKVIPASSWKNAVNRRFELDLFYRACRTPPHILDSALIAIYAAYLNAEIKPFSDFTVHDCANLAKQLYKVYDGRLRQIREIKKYVSQLKRSFRAVESSAAKGRKR